MASTKLDSTFTIPTAPPTQHVEAIWQGMLPTLEENSQELLLPSDLEMSLGDHGIGYLKTRLSYHLSEDGQPVQIIGFRDEAMGCFRIMRTPVFRSDAKRPSPGGHKVNAKSHKMRAASKKTKVPRPPNAFILFRAFRHPQLKAELPDLHNNDISIILGKEWKDAPEEVKNHFRAQAELHKARHAADHPDYQYAPRKPSEKKRRMTTRKAARLTESQNSQSDVAAYAHDTPSDDIDPSLDLFEDLPASTSAVTQLYDGTLEFTLPTDLAQELEFELEEHNDSILPEADSFFPLRPQQSGTSITPASVQNDQSFFDACVDWRKIAEDLEFIQNDPSHIKVSGNGYGNLMIGTPEDRTLFEQDLARLGSLF